MINHVQLLNILLYHTILRTIKISSFFRTGQIIKKLKMDENKFKKLDQITASFVFTHFISFRLIP